MRTLKAVSHAKEQGATTQVLQPWLYGLESFQEFFIHVPLLDRHIPQLEGHSPESYLLGTHVETGVTEAAEPNKV